MKYWKEWSTLITLGFIFNLVPLANLFLRILTKGTSCLYSKGGNALASISIIALFAISTIFMSFKNNFINAVTFDGMAILIKTYSMVVLIKLLSALLTYLRKISIIDILVSVIAKSLKLCASLFQMLIIVMLLFSSIGMCLFGGNINTNTPAEMVTKLGINAGDAPDPNSLILNFNDYYCSMYSLYIIFNCGWGGFDTANMYTSVRYNSKIAYEYFFISYFIIANLCLMNVVQSFFIDQVCQATSHDAVNEECEQAEKEKEDGEIEMTEKKPLITGEIDLDVDAGVDVPEVELEAGVDAPEVELEVGVDAPEVEIGIDADVGGDLVEPADPLNVGVEVDLDVEIAPENVDEPEG